MNEAIRPCIVGPFAPPQLTCLRSWKDCGHVVSFAHIAGRSNFLVRRTVPNYAHFKPGDVRTEEGERRFLRFIEDHRVSGITCLSTDLAIWLSLLGPRLPDFTSLWIPSPEVITLLQSKTRQLDIARDVGLDVLPTYEILQSDGAVEEIGDFPVVLRPDRDNSVQPGFKARLCQHAGELRTLVNSLELWQGPLIAQPFVDGPNYIVHGYRCRNGQQFLSGFAVRRKFEGFALTVEATDLDSDFAERCSRFAEKIGITGCYHFDFLVDEQFDRYYFLEMNGRLGGTTGKVYAVGYDEPRYLIEAFGYRPDSTPLATPELNGEVGSNKQALIRYVMSAVAGRLGRMDYPTRTLMTALKDSANGLVRWADEVNTMSDVRGTIAYHSQKLLWLLPGGRD